MEFCEPTLQAGDTVQYYSPAFVFGDPRALRSSIITRVNQNDARYPIRLDTDELLSPLTLVKKIQSGHDGECPVGLWRKLRTYTLVDGEAEVDTRRTRFCESIRNVEERSLAAIRSKTRATYAHQYVDEEGTPDEEYSSVDDVEASSNDDVGLYSSNVQASETRITLREVNLEENVWELIAPPETTYASPREAQDSMNAFARSQGYSLVVKRTLLDKQKNPRRVIYACDRHGTRRVHVAPRPGSKRRPNATSRRCNCPMELSLVRVRSGTSWVVEHRQKATVHNHAPSSSVSSHPIHRRADMTPEVRARIATDAETGVPASQTIARLLEDQPSLNITHRDIYNARRSVTSTHPTEQAAMTQSQDQSLTRMLTAMPTSIQSSATPPPPDQLSVIKSRLVRRTKPLRDSLVSALSVPVIAATSVQVMSRQDVFSVITRMFEAITRVDVNQPPGKRGLNSGEILPMSVSTMIDAMHIGSTDVFGDIGSGIGSVLAQVALQSCAARCIGIEIRLDVVSRSRECLGRFLEEYPRLSRVSILSGDVKAMTDALRVELQTCTILFCNNMVFDPVDDLAVQEFIVSSYAARLVLLTRRFCGPCHGPRCSNVFCHIWEMQSIIKVSVSWTAYPVNMYVFRRRVALPSHTPSLVEIVECMGDGDSDE